VSKFKASCRDCGSENISVSMAAENFTRKADPLPESLPKPERDPMTSRKPPKRSLPVEMPFGKYKGEEFEDIPPGYLHWCLDNMDNLSDELREAIEGALE
jgi:putative quorum-sensing-regulated virulence factor